MRIFAPKETAKGETRASLVPETVKKLSELGFNISVEEGIGAECAHGDDEYKEAGAQLVTRAAGYNDAQVVTRIHKPDEADIEALPKGCLHVSFLDPFNEGDLVKTLAGADVTAVSMEMIPRTTLAQKMDALSSQANLAGYSAVILAAERMTKILPMMMTPAGTLSPARFFIVGVGVAGLQAIATAKRLGARVDAFDTRPEVEEQVKSLGAKFVKIDLGETGSTDQGYAKALTDEQLELQRKGMAKFCAQSDVVITTAKLFGRPAPKIITKEMVDGMKNGSILVDLAAETGGNVDGTECDKEVTTDKGVRIIGLSNLEGRVAQNASQMYSSNIGNFLEHFWDKEKSELNLDLEDDILSGCVLTHQGNVVHPKFK